MASVLHKTNSPADYRSSVHTPDFDSADWFHDPDISAVASVPTKHWVVGTNPVQEMDASAKQAVDDAEAAATLAATKTADKNEVDTRLLFVALVIVLIDEINTLRQWTVSFKSEAAQATNLSNFQSRIATLPDLADRTAAQARTAIKNEIDAQ